MSLANAISRLHTQHVCEPPLSAPLFKICDDCDALRHR